MHVHHLIHNLTDERDWARALVEADTLDTLRTTVHAWSPFTPDACALVDAMTEDDFIFWRLGLSLERKGTFAGPDFASRYGALLMPAVFVDCSLEAINLHIPFGMALLKIGPIALRKRGYAEVP